MKQKHLKYPKYTIPYLIVTGVLILFVFGYTAFFTDWHSFVIKEDQSDVIDFSADWQVNGDPDINITQSHTKIYGNDVELVKKLPDTLDGQTSLCITALNARMEVKIAGKTVYRFDSVENLTGYGCGITYHTVSLKEEDAGKDVTIILSSVFSNGTGGTISRILLCTPVAFGRSVVRESMLPAAFSVLVMFFGLLMLIIHFLIPKKQTIPYHLASLGNALILIGMWCLIDTELPQYLSGCYYACRTLDYTLLHLAIFPLVLFINSLMQKKRTVYMHIAFWWPLLCVVALFVARFALGYDMHELTAVSYTSYCGTLLLVFIMLVDNVHVCKKTRTPSRLRLFYIGALTLMLASIADILYNLIIADLRMTGGYGHFLRFGLIVFLFTLVWQVLSWWTDDRMSIERDRVINKILQEAMSAQNADNKIKTVLEYLCTQLHADRAYIFEDQLDGTFANSYEWCRPGVHPEIGNLQDVPYDGVIEIWYNEYKRSNRIVIEDLEKYRATSEKMYQLLKPKGVTSLVTGPLVIEGKYVGFYGVDNPPAAILPEVSELMRLLSYVFAQIISQRDEQNTLLRNSYCDEMTGVRNRRALDEFEANERDVTKPFGFIMCDLNGLKMVNDTIGHAEGDNMIIDVATALSTVFGIQNVYRIGGDEFVIYDFADNESVFRNEVDELRKFISRKSRSVSIGAVYCKEPKADISQIKAEAESQMYAEKRSYYNGHNDRRSERRS
ncbi:MAG: GGDEF domain-containing protein [Lachnospiraceae bacterium]|nr:GGDEF domain-containing protein [Lachnospiraceae bacterium]